MAELLTTKVSRKELDEGIIPQNFVLCLIDYDNENLKTKGGLLIGFNKDVNYGTGEPNDTSSRPADLAEVSCIVYKLPARLYFNPDDPNKSMPWDCDMDLQVGDHVWTNPIEALNAIGMECESKVYRLLPYQDLYCAKRTIQLPGNISVKDIIDIWKQTGDLLYPANSINAVIMLNGYVLCEQIHKESLSVLDVTTQEQIDTTKGKIAYLGKQNRRYLSNELCDFENLSVGDVVLFDKKYKPFLLERTLYASKFSQDKLYWVVPRRRIVAKLN